MVRGKLRGHLKGKKREEKDHSQPLLCFCSAPFFIFSLLPHHRSSHPPFILRLPPNCILILLSLLLRSCLSNLSDILVSSQSPWLPHLYPSFLPFPASILRSTCRNVTFSSDSSFSFVSLSLFSLLSFSTHRYHLFSFLLPIVSPPFNNCLLLSLTSTFQHLLSFLLPLHLSLSPSPFLLCFPSFFFPSSLPPFFHCFP